MVFPYPLLADVNKDIINSFGVWGLKKFMGREYEGILRTTFITDDKGIITRVIDKVKSQSSFSTKFGGFPYPLLADVNKDIINSFGVWGLKKFMGKEYEGILRTTFITDDKGIITRVIDKVKTKDHTNQILS